jgi:adenosylcobinamide-phosphate guanylyltransferase
MHAIIMAGGKASRFGFIEKALLKFNNKSFLEIVVDALKKAGFPYTVTVSKFTPKTEKLAKKLKLAVITTPGDGYVQDVNYTLKRLSLNVALVISADLPFVESSLLRKIAECYQKTKKPVCVVVDKSEYESLGFSVGELINNNLIAVGINIISQKQEPQLLYKVNARQAININTKEDYMLLKR